MALSRIDDVQLYMGMTEDAADCYAAKKFLEDNNIKYLPYMYADDSAHPGLFGALNTWQIEGRPAIFERFPFVIYTEVDLDFPPSQYPRKCLYGKDAIINSNLPTLYLLGR